MSMSPRDRKRLDLLKRTVTKGATDDEFDLFMTYCDKFHFDPMTEVDFITYKIKNRPGEHTASIRPNTKGLTKVAQRSPDWEGMVSCVIRENDKIKVDIPNHKITHTFDSIRLLDRGGIVGAWAKCYRKGMKPFVKTITLEEFYNENNDSWDNYPTDMCEHTAERRVLMMAYGIEEWHSDPAKQRQPVRGLFPEPAGIPTPNLLSEGSDTPPENTVDIYTGDLKHAVISPDPDVEEVLEKIEQITIANEIPAANIDGVPAVGVVIGHPVETFSEDSQPPNYEDGTVLESTTQVFSFDEPTIPKTILLKNKRENAFLEKKVNEIMQKDPVAQLDADIDQMVSGQDLSHPESLSAKTKEQLGDDWYGSLTHKTQSEHDVPLHYLRYTVDTFSVASNEIEAYYQESLKSKDRKDSLLEHYYKTLAHTRVNMAKIVPIFIEQMDKIITMIVNLAAGNITDDDLFNIIRDQMDWSGEWTAWAMDYLKKRGYIS